MKTIHRRIRKLEDRFCPAEPGWLLVVSCVWRELALDQDRCIEILRECGHLPTSPGFGIVNFCEIPEGLNAEELERYLRRDGAETRGFRGAQNT
jgi:hypothetical protein